MDTRIFNPWGGTDIGLKQPNQCWFVPPTENAVARIMLPTPILQTDIRFMDKRRYYRDLGMRFLDEVEVDDLLDILRELPDQYPDPNISISTGRRRIPRAVGTLTRWIFGRIFNLLSQQETKSERIEARIPIVATDENQLRYIYPPEPVFFAGDRYHSPRWKAYLPFAPLDENWRDVAEYLGITLLSENVHERVNPGTILPEETNTLIRNFKNARPYMLAVVNSQRASATEDAIRYLTNLDIQVVDSLVVNRELTLEEGKIIPDADARIYLEETTIQRVGSAGRAQRAGVLYIRHGYERNYDLMGAPIAEYLRIPGLADAFVILLDRGGKEGKMRYLDTRQIFERDVAEMRKNLSLTGVLDAEDQDVIQDIDDHEMNNHLMRELKKELEQDTSGEELEGDDIVDDDQEASDEELTENDGDQPDERVEEANKGLVFPALVIDDVKSFPVNTENSVRPSGGEKSLRNKRNDYRWFGSWENNQKLKDAYGKRGEEVVYLLEIKRLSNLGITNPEGEVHWLREEGRPTANHDIESLDLDYGNLVPILIEVKATPGNDFRVYMSKEELLCARKNGCNYRLHRVIDITSPSPKEYIFENPYTLWKKGLAIIEPRDTYVILPDPDIDETIEER